MLRLEVTSVTAGYLQMGVTISSYMKWACMKNHLADGKSSRAIGSTRKKECRMLDCQILLAISSSFETQVYAPISAMVIEPEATLHHECDSV